MVPWLSGKSRVRSHDIVIHDGLGPEQAEAARTAEDASQNVLSGLLEPVTNGVLKHLVPLHVAY